MPIVVTGADALTERRRALEGRRRWVCGDVGRPRVP